MAMFNAVDTRVSQIYKFQLCKYTANEYTQSPQRPWETLKIGDLEVKWRAMQKVRKEYQLKVKYYIFMCSYIKIITAILWVTIFPGERECLRSRVAEWCAEGHRASQMTELERYLIPNYKLSTLLL